MKMEKTPRYTQRERNMVLGFAAQYKDVIENKRTDAESNRKKDEVWRQIAKEFNCRVYHQRSSKQLRQLYKNMKLLLKKDLCGGGGGGGGSGASGGGGGSTGGPCAPAGNCNGAGDNKSNRSFMDILNALSQQDSVAQYISEQMSPSGYSSSRQQKFDDDFDDSKLPSVAYDGLDNDVIVIKSEDISDNEQSSQNGAGCGDDMDDDDDDCLSPKDIPEVCLEEEDDEIFATDLRQPAQQQQQQQQCLHLQLGQQQSTQQQTQQLQPEITIQNVGGIRVGSIGSMANIANAAKALLNGTTTTNSISNNNNNNSNNNSITQPNNGKNGTNNTSSALNISLTTTSTTTTNNSRATLSAEQQQREQQQHLLFSGLGLSAVHAANDQQQPQLPILQHATQRLNTHNNSHLNSRSSSINNNNNRHNSLLAIHSGSASNNTHNKLNNSSHSNHHPNHHNNKNGSSGSANNNNNNDYLMSLAIEERRRKIDLLNAQIEYWKTLTKKLDANNGHNPTPSCLCHFPPAKLNGLQSQQSSS